MTKPRQQLRLVFRQSIPCSSKPLKISALSSHRRSRAPKQQESVFLRKMRELERVSPENAAALAGIADAIFAQMFGAPLE